MGQWERSELIGEEGWGGWVHEVMGELWVGREVCVMEGDWWGVGRGSSKSVGSNAASCAQSLRGTHAGVIQKS